MSTEQDKAVGGVVNLEHVHSFSYALTPQRRMPLLPSWSLNLFSTVMPLWLSLIPWSYCTGRFSSLCKIFTHLSIQQKLFAPLSMLGGPSFYIVIIVQDQNGQNINPGYAVHTWYCQLGLRFFMRCTPPFPRLGTSFGMVQFEYEKDRIFERIKTYFIKTDVFYQCYWNCSSDNSWLCLTLIETAVCFNKIVWCFDRQQKFDLFKTMYYPFKPSVKYPTGGDLNAFTPRVDKVRYKMLYLEKESRQKYKNFGRLLLCMEFWNDNAKNSKILT